ncbi:hypothetical protein ACFL27_07935 [candidate division CSSED10-310 bacterium]|uniref:Sortilin N-terminal domain-containing protein n=1 Tax=candidate division CSSED10-310 bacterium TaxID=2855610 RepID=A0ABV6YV78_UNCC1
MKLSSDAGRHWVDCDNGLDDDFVWSLEIHPSNPYLLYVETLNEGIFVSSNGGMEWCPFEQEFVHNAALEVTIDQNRPQRLLLGDYYGNIFIFEKANEEQLQLKSQARQMFTLPTMKIAGKGRHAGRGPFFVDRDGMCDNHEVIKTEPRNLENNKERKAKPSDK